MRGDNAGDRCARPERLPVTTAVPPTPGEAAAATDRAESYESMAQEERTEAAEHQARQEDQP